LLFEQKATILPAKVQSSLRIPRRHAGKWRFITIHS